MILPAGDDGVIMIYVDFDWHDFIMGHCRAGMTQSVSGFVEGFKSEEGLV